MPEFGDLWKGGVADRERFVRRARRNAFLTHPYLAPPFGEGDARSEDLPDPRQSVGSDGVTNLAAKLAISLFPPQSTFFRYVLDKEKFFAAGGDPSKLPEAELSLSQRAAAIQNRLDTSGFRVRLIEALENEIVTGTSVLRLTERFTWRAYGLSEVVLYRDGDDELDALVVREVISRDRLPEDIRSRAEPAGDRQRNQVYLLTGNVKEGGKWRTHQEAGGITLPESAGTYTKDKFPWLAPRMIVKSGEDYGRAYIDGVIGNLVTLEGLTENLAQYAALATRMVGINPAGSGIRNKKLTEARNGEWLTGSLRPDMGFLKADKLSDIQAAVGLREDIKRDLQRRFLLLNPVRDAERVTAEEVARTSQELTETLGGAFTVLGDELQSPIVRLLESRMVSAGELRQLEDGVASPKVVTGLDAIGRTRDEVSLNQYAASIQAIFGPERTGEILDDSGYANRLAAAKGFDPTGLVRTPEEMAQREQQRAQQKVVEAAAPNIANQAARSVAPQQ